MPSAAQIRVLVRRGALDVVAALGTDAWAVVLELVHDAEPLVRGNALALLGDAGDASAASVLIDALVANWSSRFDARLALHAFARRFPRSVAAMVIKRVNGRLGDSLLEIGGDQRWLVDALTSVMLVAGATMESASAGCVPLEEATKAGVSGPRD